MTAILTLAAIAYTVLALLFFLEVIFAPLDEEAE